MQITAYSIIKIRKYKLKCGRVRREEGAIIFGPKPGYCQSIKQFPNFSYKQEIIIRGTNQRVKQHIFFPRKPMISQFALLPRIQREYKSVKLYKSMYKVLVEIIIVSDGPCLALKLMN